MLDTNVCVMLGHWMRQQMSDVTALFFRQIPWQTRPPSHNPSMAASSSRSAESTTVRDAEQQEEELQLISHSPNMQRGLPDSSSNTIRLRPNDKLVSLQTLNNSRLCRGAVHPRAKKLLAQQLLQVRPSNTYVL